MPEVCIVVAANINDLFCDFVFLKLKKKYPGEVVSLLITDDGEVKNVAKQNQVVVICSDGFLKILVPGAYDDLTMVITLDKGPLGSPK